MTDETTQEKPLTKMEETRQLLDKMEKASQTAKAEADRLEGLKSDALLSGTAGIRPQETKLDKTPKEKAKEYAQSIMAGKRPE